MKESDASVCGVCGGDGRLENAWGQVARCPSCGGTGRRRADTGFHDVTKTKEAHHQNTNRIGAPVAKQTWPTTPTGIQLATEVKASSLAAEAKERLTLEIIEHESTHGQVTKTFAKKVHKQMGPASTTSRR